ncbi:MAG: formyl transferase [Phycisphaerae bacterium]
MKPPRVLLLTSDQPRHARAARRLAAGSLLCGVVRQPKPPAALDPVTQCHFAARAEAERRWCGSGWPAVPQVFCDDVNGPAVAGLLASATPDLLLLFGCGVVKRALLEAWPGRIVNLHLGLSPYYRGAGTNFWALADGRPECVGATLHVATAAIDDGPILAQARPELSAEDDLHAIGLRALDAGLDLLAPCLTALHRGALGPQRLSTAVPRVCRRRDFDAAALAKLERALANGMIAGFLAERAAREARYPIVEWRCGASVAPAAEGAHVVA